MTALADLLSDRDRRRLAELDGSASPGGAAEPLERRAGAGSGASVNGELRAWLTRCRLRR